MSNSKHLPPKALPITTYPSNHRDTSPPPFPPIVSTAKNSALIRPTFTHQAAYPQPISQSHLGNSSSHANKNTNLKRTIYFEGFPSNWNVQVLHLVFLRFGIVGTISIARKTNVRQLHFGFLRPHQDLSMSMAIKKINTIEIGSRKLRAFVARFPNKLNRAPISTTLKNPIEPRRKFFPSSRDSRSYADVTRPRLANQPPQLVMKLHYGKAINKLQWTHLGSIVTVRKIETIPKLESITKVRNFATAFVAPAGGLLAVVGFYSKDALNV